VTCSYRKPKMGRIVPNMGFISLSLTGWLIVGASVLFAGMGIALKVQSSRLDACKAEYAAFVAQVKAQGEIAEKQAKEQELKDKKAKEKADAENKANRDRIADLTKRLRDANSRSSLVSAPQAGSRKPEVACYSRADLDRALSRFEERIAGLLAEGDSAITDLNTAKEWLR
jgi:hypothetical protein